MDFLSSIKAQVKAVDNVDSVSQASTARSSLGSF